jgi:hypothetical protein
MLVSGVEIRSLLPTMQFIVQDSSTNEGVAFVVVLFSFFRSLGVTVGVTIGGTFFHSLYYME